jgi:hypothetical protein
MPVIGLNYVGNSAAKEFQDSALCPAFQDTASRMAQTNASKWFKLTNCMCGLSAPPLLLLLCIIDFALVLYIVRCSTQLRQVDLL